MADKIAAAGSTWHFLFRKDGYPVHVVYSEMRQTVECSKRCNIIIELEKMAAAHVLKKFPALDQRLTRMFVAVFTKCLPLVPFLEPDKFSPVLSVISDSFVVNLITTLRSLSWSTK